ncbi:high-affinity choline transporter 1-like isoform X3 [Dermacentor albipictus]|uniref:high-affinity choline transporter 1-like isoform X3 n=1 Tax=Dermacentor albipictus TaxID=60249 RepID=UPI0031FD6356
MAVHNIPAVLAMLLYFLVIVCVGVWSGCKLHVFKEDGQVSTTDMRRRRPHQNRFLHRLFLADRNMSLTLGISSMTATWVGGGYLNGTAEAVYTDGVLYCHAPIGYAISLILGGFFFAQKMRTANAVTMLDPFQEHYGRWMGLLLCLPALCGEVLWTAAVLAALGDTAGAVMEVDSHIFIIIAATTILFYTALGGHYSVVYTDVFQICTTAVFLVYFQCILGCKSDFAAQVLSYVAAIGCVFMALPPMIIGAAAKTTNFTAAGYPGPWQLSDKSSVLPQSIRYLTTPVVSIMGMLGITAAVMSSADSSMFSASAMVTKNVYHVLIRPDASETEVAVILRIAICLIGSTATFLALSVHSVFELWTLCSDVVYVLLFPQFVCIFYLKDSNTYGSIIAFVLGAYSRWLCGEPTAGSTTSTRVQPHEPERVQQFPFRLACMVLSLAALVIGSLVSAMAFEKHWLPPHCDVFGCFRAPQHGEGSSRRDGKLWTRPEVTEYEQTIKTGAESVRSELSEHSQMPAGRSRATSEAVLETSGKSDRSQRTTGSKRSGSRRRRKSRAAAASARTPETSNRGGHVGKHRQHHAKKAINETHMTVKEAEISGSSRRGRHGSRLRHK